MNNDDNNSSDNGNNGVLGKFRQRLKLIKINRYKKLKKSKNTNFEEEEDFFKEGKSINSGIKMVDDIKNTNKSDFIKVHKIKIKKARVETKLIDKRKIIIARKSIKNKVVYGKEDLFIAGVIKRIKATSKDRDYGIRYGIGKNKIRNNKALEQEQIDKERDQAKEELKLRIVGKIKDNLEELEAEVDVLESELYYTYKSNDKELELEKVEALRVQIEEITNKINNIMDEYNLYRNDYDLYDITSVSDDSLVDDIINFKNIINSYKDKTDLVNEYKLLDEYRNLYDKLDRVKTFGNQLIQENEEKIQQFDVRDSNYDRIKDELVHIDSISLKCDEEIKRQNEYLKQLMSKISKIDSRKYTEYKLRGLNELIGQSIKYIGLLMVSPLKGLIPNIALSTFATRRMIRNIRRNMHVDKIDKIYYEAVDYDREIGSKLNDIDYTYYLIDDTIDMINGLKGDFISQYNSNIPGYEETMNKIDTILDEVKKNRYRMDKIKKNMIDSKKLNADKMVKVRKLNKSSN